MNAKLIAKLLGLSIILIGIGGVILGEKSLLGILNIDFEEDIFHLASGSLLLAVGLRASNKTAGLTLGVLGAIYLIIGLLSFVVPGLFSFLEHGYSVVDNLIHVSLGVIGLVAYKLSWDK
jgi:hypothetical protein